MGGRNAEGEDFPGNEMNAVVLVGIPYAQPTASIEAQVRYYTTVFPTKGRYYGYYLPAHRKLSQGAGRAHRLLTDRAAIVFLDERVAQPFVRKDVAQWIRSEMRIIPDKDEILGRMIHLFFTGEIQ
jgi:DNA excision repair protein ERCC-2